ncbi:MAG: M24 family metallopeptidase, partial [Limosilactobacillus sp.]|nr:M24 family metallopeptidase [Limosilactobacillus sp.]
MISLKSTREIDDMAAAGAVLAGMHLGLRDIVKPGISSWKIEEFAREYFKDRGAIAAQIGFEGYKYATCVSINDEICHGFPRKQVTLKNGDLVKIDTVVEYNGAFSDSCWSYAVGEVTPAIAQLMDVTKQSLYLGIDQAVVGNRLGD